MAVVASGMGQTIVFDGGKVITISPWSCIDNYPYMVNRDIYLLQLHEDGASGAPLCFNAYIFGMYWK